jgi:hypothetical protein
MDLNVIEWEGEEHWIILAEDRDKWWAFVRMVMDLRVS